MIVVPGSIALGCIGDNKLTSHYGSFDECIGDNAPIEIP
jgi:hypothetical protein